MAGGHYEQALDWFRRSYAHYPSPRMRYNIGVALDKLGRSAAAVGQYEDFLAAESDDPAARAYAEARVAALAPTVARLDVELSPAQANLWIAGEPALRGVGKGVPVTPGLVHVAAELPGYDKATVEVTVAAGEELRVTLTLTPTPSLAPATGAPRAPAPSLTLTAELPEDHKPPLRRRAWLWAAIGSGVAVAAGAVVLGVTLGRHDRYPSPSLGDVASN
jgi:hypothetical protein